MFSQLFLNSYFTSRKSLGFQDMWNVRNVISHLIPFGSKKQCSSSSQQNRTDTFEYYLNDPTILILYSRGMKY